MCDDRYSNLLFILFDQKHNQFENDKVEEVEELNVTLCLKKNDLKKKIYVNTFCNISSRK